MITLPKHRYCLQSIMDNAMLEPEPLANDEDSSGVPTIIFNMVTTSEPLYLTWLQHQNHHILNGSNIRTIIFYMVTTSEPSYFKWFQLQNHYI
ncbi:hypothetical protein PVAND_014361 [Polypedilum vanderplanki]|uniref:Uncharacterized protein n=1 Tax=Polypedilum vanderplanki TaxID=319348 RepID=A0A9J6B9M4_POLVA|nr:hypothetical protein PVAND_014361 [Polypedilum vanderplanki]